MVETIERARRWLFEDALPVWCAKGVDREFGGYVEQFTLHGEPGQAAFKRTRVICRQIYSFAHAYELGWAEGGEAARHGVQFLLKKCWLGKERGLARRLTRAGDVLDETPDLYDYAFALFATGWAYRIMQDPQLIAFAHELQDAIERLLAHPGGEGFWHESPAIGWRQQNPHMHMMEGALSLFESTGQERFGELANDIGLLFQKRFYDADSQTLAEFFNGDWTRAEGEDGRKIEPGHHFEWAWILKNLYRLTGLDLRDEARGLVAFAERSGIHPEMGWTCNVVSDAGEIIDAGTRSWTNTERIKAAVAMYELDEKDPLPVIQRAVDVLFDHHFARAPSGMWMDALDAHGNVSVDRIPSSTLYHVVLAIAEMIRIEPALSC